MLPRVALGQSDFRALREGDFVYVDKTELIKDILDDGAQVILVPRPRRFGKTLNLTMLRNYLEKSDTPLWQLFEGLFISRAGDGYKAHFQKYPVIYLTFKDVKAPTWELVWDQIRNKIAALFSEHDALLGGGDLREWEARRFRAVLDGTADQAMYESALLDLSRFLERRHGEKVVVLVDEYDTPIHEGFLRGYYDKVIPFFRNFFSAVFKDNTHLSRAVITGILRVAKESLFSGLNNLKVCSVLREELATGFGFTEPEVEHLIGTLADPSLLPEVRRWYNGYVFGGQVIYNPWSVLSLLNSADRELRPYWVSTSSSDLLRELLIDRYTQDSPDMEALLSGKTIEKPLLEGVALREVSEWPDTIWSFLVFSGYLKVVSLRREEGTAIGQLAIPNFEVRGAFEQLFRTWLTTGLGGSGKVSGLLSALLAGDADTVASYLDDLLLNAFSVHDTEGALPAPRGQKGPRRLPPERVYQAFILGLLVNLAPRYEVRSNRESGYGRYDVMILPKASGQPGIVLELKVLDKRRKETPKKALASALKQIKDRDYAAELRARGASPVHEMGIVFEGKRSWVRKAG